MPSSQFGGCHARHSRTSYIVRQSSISCQRRSSCGTQSISVGLNDHLREQGPIIDAALPSHAAPLARALNVNIDSIRHSDDNRQRDAVECGSNVVEAAIHIHLFRPPWGTISTELKFRRDDENPRKGAVANLACTAHAPKGQLPVSRLTDGLFTRCDVLAVRAKEQRERCTDSGEQRYPAHRYAKALGRR